VRATDDERTKHSAASDRRSKVSRGTPELVPHRTGGELTIDRIRQRSGEQHQHRWAGLCAPHEERAGNRSTSPPRSPLRAHTHAVERARDGASAPRPVEAASGTMLMSGSSVFDSCAPADPSSARDRTSSAPRGRRARS